MEQQSKNLERTVNELGRKSNLQQEEADEFKRLYDEERRKTQTNEKTVGQLANENKNLNNRLRTLQSEVEDYKSTI